MGKKGAGTGVNTKVQAAREKQAAVEGARAAKAQAAQEAAEAKEWSKGANQRGSKREDEAARKQEEKASKIAAKKALQAEEAEQLSGFKSVVVDVPPWEAALMSSSVSNKEKKRQEAAKRQAQAEEARKAKAERAEKEAKAMRDSGIQMGDDSDLSGSANPNRKGADGGDGGDWASGIDAAIGSLSLEGAGPAERHPEKRLKAEAQSPRPQCLSIRCIVRASLIVI
ncbi:unnamed protein product [Ectocarpus sp. CCAP 1310/34]|nr:unnamed protein product [Ectocarpus sp. CCAP 1310/34]